MGDYKKEQEAMFQEAEARLKVATDLWMKDFVKAAAERGFTVVDLLRLLDEPGATPVSIAQFVLSKPIKKKSNKSK